MCGHSGYKGSAAFDRVNHQGILYQLCSVGIRGSLLSTIYIDTVSIKPIESKHVIVNGCLSKLVNVMSGVPQGSIFGPLLFLHYTSEIFYILENKLIGYGDDFPLMAIIAPSPGVIVTVAGLPRQG